MKNVFEKSPAAWAGIIQAAVTLAAVYVKDLPVEAVLGLIAAATGLSFGAQRVENAKTEVALWSDPLPDDPDSPKKRVVRKATK